MTNDLSVKSAEESFTALYDRATADHAPDDDALSDVRAQSASGKPMRPTRTPDNNW